MSDSAGISSLSVATTIQYSIAARALDVVRQSGDASVELLQAAAKAAGSASASADQAVQDTTKLLDTYA
ncbi:MAG: hypothetical protein U0573_03640 [Phycisphaerales bacterium]|nr:hypothetical protein [Planctomycetota bacterium]